MSDVVRAIAEHDAESRYLPLAGILRDMDRERHLNAIVQTRFEFTLTIGCIFAKRENVDVEDWGIDEEAWGEMDDDDRFSIIDAKLAEWKIEALEEVLEKFLKENCDAEYK